MTLINTEGLALIGPGLEWFWTALQFTALAITFYAIYRQLQAQHIQMEENTKLLRSQAHHNALTLSQRARELLIENERFARVVNVGYATPEALSDVDWARCSSYMFLQFNQWEYLYYQHRDGSIPTESWVGAEDYYRNMVAGRYLDIELRSIGKSASSHPQLMASRRGSVRFRRLIRVWLWAFELGRRLKVVVRPRLVTYGSRFELNAPCGSSCDRRCEQYCGTGASFRLKGSIQAHPGC